MTHTVTIPKLGLTMEEGTVVEWFHADGDAVRKGEPLYSVETDKIVSEIEAEHDGFLRRVAPVDTTLPVGGVVAYLHATAEAARTVAGGDGAPSVASRVEGDGGAPSVTSPAAPAGAVAGAGSSTPAAEPSAAHPAALTLPAAAAGARVLISPVARKLAQARGVDYATLAGSGPGGVILKRDIESAAPAVPVERPAGGAAPPAAQPEGSREGSLAGAARRPLGSRRKAIAQRMMHSLASSAQMTGFGKVDMTEAVRLREALVAAGAGGEARVSITDIALKAAASVLAEMPEINAYIDGDDVVTCGEINIGLAVALDDGLVVPVIRNVDRLTFGEVAQRRKTVVDNARASRLTRADVEGATFTLSNFGSYGGDFETPILNPPQSALLGIGRIEETPVVRNGEIVIRSIMSISLTFDHRLLDGAVAGRFRARFRALLEQPRALDGDAAMTTFDPTRYGYDTAPLDAVLCEGVYDVTAGEIDRFRRLMGYPPRAAGTEAVTPASMGLIYGLRLGWEHAAFPPGVVRMGDEDVFGTPARDGDRLVTRLSIVEKFEKNGRRFMKYEMTTRNQREELVCSVSFMALVP